MLYEDRLDGRIDAVVYDQKAGAIRGQQQALQQKLLSAQDATLLPASQAVDMMALTSRAADLFLEQTRTEQRKLLHLLLQEASWKAGELRMSFREPFEQLRLSNRASASDFNGFGGNERDFGIWR